MGGIWSALFGSHGSYTDTPTPTAAPYATATPAPAAAGYATLAPTLAPIPEPGPAIVIPGNNGSVSCARYCNGGWGQGQLASRFPLYSGAYSTQSQAAADGTCPCILSNRVTWNQNQGSGITAADLGIR